MLRCPMACNKDATSIESLSCMYLGTNFFIMNRDVAQRSLNEKSQDSTMLLPSMFCLTKMMIMIMIML